MRVGFTNDLASLMIEHREKLYPASFTARYVYDMLVRHEEYARAVSARLREKKLKLILLSLLKIQNGQT